jgi:hypothetical protein
VWRQAIDPQHIIKKGSLQVCVIKEVYCEEEYYHLFAVNRFNRMLLGIWNIKNPA